MANRLDTPSAPNGTSRSLEDRLQDPQTLAALNRLLDQADTLAKTVETAETLMQQGPGLISMVTDSIDEVVMSSAESGTDLEIVLQNSVQVAAKLQNPQLTKILGRLLEQTESLELLVSMLEQAPGVMATMADSLDEMAHSASETGIEFDIMLPRLLQLGAKVQNPKVFDLLERTLDQTEAIEMLLNLFEQGPSLAAMVADSLDEIAQSAAEAGLDLEQLLQHLFKVPVKLAPLLDSGELDALLESGMLEPQTLQVLGKVGKALSQGYALDQSQPQKVSIFGLIGMINDPDIQRVLGFLNTFGKQFGQTLDQK